MNFDSLKEIVARVIAEMSDGSRVSPTWVAKRAMELSDPTNKSPPVVSFAANLEFRQIAREKLRAAFESENPDDPEPRQHALFPGLQAMYPKHRVGDQEPEYVRPELLDADDISWNVARMRACAVTLQRRADALEAWAQTREAA